MKGKTITDKSSKHAHEKLHLSENYSEVHWVFE